MAGGVRATAVQARGTPEDHARQRHEAVGAGGLLTELSREDVLQILDIVDKSHFDFFELQMGDLKLTVSKTGLVREATSAAAPAPGTEPAPAPAPTPAPAAAAAAAPAPVAAPAPSADGLVPVKAPMVGIFYAQAEPGAPPYVEKGARVEADTTLGLIEVMKVFNTIRAGVHGTVAEILVENAQLVEFGEAIFLIRPDEAANGERP
ncbi:MAG: acetyl-CoA carboxylase biotin carboxyl carrier protein [Streptosporangiales bacterium]|nr:acetyl-CoA carboxylase biotin carboxyl carrier protein [Streptosporangiales bacterium]